MLSFGKSCAASGVSGNPNCKLIIAHVPHRSLSRKCSLKRTGYYKVARLTRDGDVHVSVKTSQYDCINPPTRLAGSGVLDVRFDALANI
jgi:hypothetical protein